MTDEEVHTLEVMCDPNRWAMRPLLPLVNKQKKDNIGWTVGVLVEAPLGRYVWYPGANIAEQNSPNNIEALQNARTLLAYQLEDLVREGWEVD